MVKLVIKWIMELLKCKWTYVLIGTFSIPIIINGLMWYSTQWTKGEVGDWISFYGSFAGGIITLIALFMTLNHNESIQKQIRHDSVRPYIKAWHLNGAVDYNDYLKKVPTYDFFYNSIEKKFEKKVDFNDGNGNKSLFGRHIVVENIGQGIATEFKISISDEMSKCCYTDDITFIAKDSKEIYRFLIDKEFVKVGKYKMKFEYQDVLRKSYFQELEFEIIESLSQNTGFNLEGFTKISQQQEIKK